MTNHNKKQIHDHALAVITGQIYDLYTTIDGNVYLMISIDSTYHEIAMQCFDESARSVAIARLNPNKIRHAPQQASSIPS